MLLSRILILCAIGIILHSFFLMPTEGIEQKIQNDVNMQDAKFSDINTSVGFRQVENENLTISSMDGEGYVFFGDERWQNYIISATATFVDVSNERRWLAVLFRGALDGSKPWSQFTVRYKSTYSDGVEFAVKKESGWDVRQSCCSEKDSIIGSSRRLRIIVEGSHIKAFLDDKLVIESYLCVERQTGCVGLGVSGCIAKFNDFSIHRLADTPIKDERTNSKLCEIIAHRGFSALAPENTIASIKKAIESGADGCEFDVRQCRDGVIVLMHDEHVERTTDGNGKISNLTHNQIKKLDAGSWKSDKFIGERVPTLDEALNILKDSNSRPFIEIKTGYGYKETLNVIRNLDMTTKVFVMSFDVDVLKKVRQLEPNLKCILLNNDKVTTFPIQQARKIGETIRACKTNMVGLDYKILSADLISILHENGIAVYAWTVDDYDIAEALVKWGIDGIITNKPDNFVRFR